MEKWFVIFDTETTDKNPKIADMLEFGAIKCRFTENGLDTKSISYTDQYFNIDYEVPIGARSVNGLTRELVQKYSNGDYLEDKIDCLKDWIYNPDLIPVNYNSGYDLTVLKNNLLRAGLPNYEYKTSLDIMKFCKNKYTNRNIKLVQARQEYILAKRNITLQQFDDFYVKLFKKNAKNHTALYDAYVTWRLLIEFINNGTIKLSSLN